MTLAQRKENWNLYANNDHFSLPSFERKAPYSTIKKGKFKGLIDSRALRCRYHSINSNLCVCGHIPLVSSPLRNSFSLEDDHLVETVPSMRQYPSSSSSSSSSSSGSFPSLTLSYFTRFGRPKQWEEIPTDSKKPATERPLETGDLDPSVTDTKPVPRNVTELLGTLDTDASIAVDGSAAGQGSIIKFVTGSDYMFNKKLMTLLHKDKELKSEEEDSGKENGGSRWFGSSGKTGSGSGELESSSFREAGLDQLRCRPLGKKNKIQFN